LGVYWEEALHSLPGKRHVVDVRNIGLIAGIELEPLPVTLPKRAPANSLMCD
jgi:beta-alanine--pyruvate transaminase